VEGLEALVLWPRAEVFVRSEVVVDAADDELDELLFGLLEAVEFVAEGEED
jgi:hypothetical protein